MSRKPTLGEIVPAHDPATHVSIYCDRRNAERLLKSLMYERHWFNVHFDDRRAAYKITFGHMVDFKILAKVDYQL